jgi:hypothetical protein
MEVVRQDRLEIRQENAHFHAASHDMADDRAPIGEPQRLGLGRPGFGRGVKDAESQPNGPLRSQHQFLELGEHRRRLD